ALYFFGGYVAGLSGMEWIALFVFGLALVALEVFFFSGTGVLGLSGGGLMLVGLVLAMVGVFPGMPTFPSFTPFALRVPETFVTLLGAILVGWGLSRWLPKTTLYSTLVSQSASGVVSVHEQEKEQASRLGQVGVTISALRPSGKAQFEAAVVDVITQGELIE